ncbi:MAG TPA: amino acid permease [Solirubrobacterales bacterium]|nr:amino acid permease [Solirubrobacterales bacterium]
MRLGRIHLFVAFAFTVMADPVSSVAYAIEAAQRALDGDPAALFATMAIVVGIVVVVAITYHQLIGRFPQGGGGPEAVAHAFGEGWAFLPLGALLVDFTLTVAVSCAAAAAALIAYAPELSAARLPIALGIATAVAFGVLVGHRGRVAFALAAQAFLLIAAFVILGGLFADPAAAPAAAGGDGGTSLLADASLAAVLLALPLGMALATGIEAPSNAIAELPQLDDRGRRRFGRATLWSMVAIVGGLTLCFAALAVRLEIGLPDGDSTMLAELARTAVGDGAAFAAFQLFSALLLLAAAASSYLAGSGVLKALSGVGLDGTAGLLPEPLHRENRHLVSHWGVFVVLALAAAMIAAAGGREQVLVQFYAVSVFASFLAATLACARLTLLDGNRPAALWNLLGAALVAGVLALNLTRLDSAIALLASAAIAAYLWRSWVARGRPRGVAGPGQTIA